MGIFDGLKGFFSKKDDSYDYDVSNLPKTRPVNLDMSNIPSPRKVQLDKCIDKIRMNPNDRAARVEIEDIITRALNDSNTGYLDAVCTRLEPNDAKSFRAIRDDMQKMSEGARANYTKGLMLKYIKLLVRY